MRLIVMMMMMMMRETLFTGDITKLILSYLWWSSALSAYRVESGFLNLQKINRIVQEIGEKNHYHLLPVPSNNNNDPFQTQHLTDLCWVTITSHQDMVTVTIKIPDLEQIMQRQI